MAETYAKRPYQKRRIVADCSGAASLRPPNPSLVFNAYQREKKQMSVTVNATPAKKPAKKAAAKAPRPIVASNPARAANKKAAAELDALPVAKTAPKKALAKKTAPAKKVAKPVAKPTNRRASDKKPVKERIIDMISRKDGANEAEVCRELGWVRAATTMRRAMDGSGLKFDREKGTDGKFRYFLKG
jgi:hypothetical protein